MKLWTVAPALLILAAAPGEPLPTKAEVPERVGQALARRLGDELVSVHLDKVLPSQDLPGFVACGRATEKRGDQAETTERFFVVVPGSFAVLDRDGTSLVDLYWTRYGC